jgi:hypothetical protein
MIGREMHGPIGAFSVSPLVSVSLGTSERLRFRDGGHDFSCDRVIGRSVSRFWGLKAVCLTGAE